MVSFIDPIHLKERHNIRLKMTGKFNPKPVLDQRKTFNNDIIVGDQNIIIFKHGFPSFNSNCRFVILGADKLIEGGCIYEDFFHLPYISARYLS